MMKNTKYLYIECDKSYFTKKSCCQHIGKVHKKTYKCNIKGCSKAYARKREFEAHKRSHTPLIHVYGMGIFTLDLIKCYNKQVYSFYL